MMFFAYHISKVTSRVQVRPFSIGVIHIPRGQPRGEGVDEVTMKGHEGEGRVLEMTTWSLGLKGILRQIKK